jgi:outer membrane protein assembly factor BamD
VQEVKPVAPKTAQEWFDAGIKYLNDKKYDKAVDAFQRIALEYATTRYAADAQFYLAETYFAERDYVSAASEYEFLTTNYATSPFYEEASYKTALCYFRKSPNAALDQSDLGHAQELLELLRERDPNTQFLPQIDSLNAQIESRFAKKEYDAGMLYARAGEFASAKVYFQHILDQYPSASVKDEVRLQLAICLDRTGEKDQARQIYTDLSQNSDPKLRTKAVQMLARMK